MNNLQIVCTIQPSGLVFGGVLEHSHKKQKNISVSYGYGLITKKGNYLSIRRQAIIPKM